MKLKSLILILLALFTFSSCGIGLKYNTVYPLYQTCVLKNGLWGNWENQYSFEVAGQYNSEVMSIYIYYKDDHPSDYCMKITINKKIRSIDGHGLYSSYEGSIEVTNNNIIDSWLNDTGIHTATILCDEKMDKAIENNGFVGTLNVLYNGIGRGFTFWQRDNYY